MRRFFFTGKATEGVVHLPADESRHITKVLRLDCGEEIELLDGRGGLYSAVIASLGEPVTAEIREKLETDGAAVPVRVAQGLLKGQKMDLVIQKATELGASVFIPFQASRSQGKQDTSQARKKQERWQRISLEACKQCMRADSMAVVSPVSFVDLIEASEDDGRVKLIFWEEEKEMNLEKLPSLKGVAGVDIILGPEGGISQEEIEHARSYGWQTVSLGKRILRAETATITALSLVMFLTGNFS